MNHKTETENEHADVVRKSLKPDGFIREDLRPGDCNLLHLAIGICGEAAELADAIKKHVIYRKPLDTANVIEELGDIEYFLEAIRQALDIHRMTTLGDNSRKILKRYPGLSYSNESAQLRRDKDGSHQ
jgi:NTP pyrophosphatase (non-canonical NTP hydrolase)